MSALSAEEEPGFLPWPQRRLLMIVAVAVGAVCWLVAGNNMPMVRWMVLLGAIAVSLLPPVTTVLAAWLNRLRTPSPRSVEWTGLAVGVVATAYLVGTAFLQERPLAPRMIDESSYAISAQLLAHGRLWLPQHPLADFFDSLFLVVRPKYSSIYFPGTGLAFAPAVWFGWASWILPVVISGFSVAMIYRIITEITGDSGAGLLAVIWMVSLRAFRTLSVMMMSQTVMLALGLLMVWTWLRWRRSQRRLAWTVLIGALAGWAAITRPVDALAYAIPIGVAMAAAMRRLPLKVWLSTALLLVFGAIPFLALQMTHNVGITGKLFETPYTAYLQREQPGAQYGIRTYNPAWQPESTLPQVRDYYDWCRMHLQRHQPNNFWKQWFKAQQWPGGQMRPAYLLTVIDYTLPGRPLLLLLFPGCIAALIHWRRPGRGPIIPLAAVLPLFLFLYVFNPFFLRHYLVVVAPAMILLVLIGAQAVAKDSGNRWSDRVRVAITVSIFALSFTGLWEMRWLLSPVQRPMSDGFQESAPQSQVDLSLGLLVQAPAVILFTTPPDIWTESVYNVNVALPDDAPIIRAHDLGPRNDEIVNYYAQRQPDRTFYRFDWRKGSLQPLGQASALSSRLRNGDRIELLTGAN